MQLFYSVPSLLLFPLSALFFFLALNFTINYQLQCMELMYNMVRLNIGLMLHRKFVKMT